MAEQRAKAIHSQPGGAQNKDRHGIHRLAIIASVAGGLVAVCVVAWATVDFWRTAWVTVTAHVTSPDAFRAWIDGFGVWAPVVYVLAVAAQVIVAPIPGSVFPVVGAAAFGPLPALLLTTGGMLLGSTVMFALARRWGRPLVERLIGRQSLDKYADIVAARGGLWIFLIYLLPLLPDDAVSAVAGLSGISLRRFLVLCLLGRLPTTVFSVYTTAELLTQPAWVWLTAALVLVTGVAMGIRSRGRLEAWLLRRSHADGDREKTASDEGGDP